MRVIWLAARRHHQPLLTTLYYAAFSITAACTFIPFQPRQPDSSLDYSWMMGMNVAIRDHIAIGRDLIFTFGPYSSIYSMQYSPATDLLMMGGSAWLALCFINLVPAIVRRSWVLALALLYVMASFMFSRDALFNSLSLFYALFAFEAGAETDAPAARPRKIVNALVLGASALGLLVTVKVSLIPLAVVSWVAAVVLMARAHRWPLALGIALAAPVTTVFAWLIAGQPSSAIPDYLINAVPISGGYTEAMSTSGPAGDVLVYLAAAALCVGGGLIVTRPRRFDGLIFTAVLALFLFLSFKGAFVRQDGHVLAAATAIIVGALVLLALKCDVATIFIATVAVAALCTIDMGFMHSWQELLLNNTQRTYGNAIEGLQARRSGDLALRYDRALRQIRDEVSLPSMPGSSDLYFHSLAYLLVSPNRWDPRPILQSYSTYTPDLMETNARHLDGNVAPDNVFVKIEAIDHRFPSMDDGLSWFELLGRYEPRSIIADTVVLTKKAPEHAQVLARTRLNDVRAALGETVKIPDYEGLIAVQLKFRRGPVGKLVSAAFKPPGVSIVSTLSDDSTRTNRLIPEMTTTDFLLSPYVETANDFVLLYGDNFQLGSKKVVSFVISQEPGPGGIDPGFDAIFSTIPAPTATKDVSVYDPVIASPAQPEDVTSSQICTGSIDKINGVVPTRRNDIHGPLTIDGWAAFDAVNGILADAVMIELRSDDGAKTVFATHSHQRDDISTYFRRNDMRDAGYAMFAKTSGLHGNYSAVVLLKKGMRTIECSNLSVPVQIGGTGDAVSAGADKSDASVDDPLQELPNLPDNLVPSQSCVGSLDEINGAPLTKRHILRGPLAIVGWAVLDPINSFLPDIVRIKLRRQGSPTITFPTHPQRRDDLSAFFHRDEMAKAGFSTLANTSGMKGVFTAVVVLEKGAQTIECSNLSALVEIR